MAGRRRIAVSELLMLVWCLGAPFLCAQAQEANTTPPPNPAASSAAQPTDPKQLCTVAGTVTSLATGELLKKAEITLSPVASPELHRRPVTATTDANGHFAIEGLAPGRYLMSVGRDGYLTQEYGEQDSAGPGAVLSLAPGEKMTDLVYRLQKTAVITGRVVDEDGEAMARASVEVLRRRTVNGSEKFELESNGNTDDLGMYRIFGLRPGKYFVRVNVEGRKGMFVMNSGNSDPGEQEEAAAPPASEYPETYYPGTTDSSRASAIDVKPGDEIPRIDFFLTPRQALKRYRIRGRVTNAMTGQSGGALAVTAIPPVREEADPFGRFIAQPDQKTGNFTIEGVPPGSYAVAAFTLEGGKIRVAMQQVEVTNADVDSVSLVLTRGVDISGRITYDGQSAARSEDVTVSLQPRNQEMPFGAPSESSVKADGTFSFTEVSDGGYSIEVTSKCGECYLKSATANGVDLLEQGVTVGSGGAPTSIVLVYSSNTGKASGTVTSADDLPVPGAYVVFVKDAPARVGDGLPPSVTTDQYGKFELSGIPPGRYRAVAFEKIPPDISGDPDYVKAFAAKADSFDVEAGATATLQLKAVEPSAAEPSN